MTRKVLGSFRFFFFFQGVFVFIYNRRMGEAGKKKEGKRGKGGGETFCFSPFPSPSGLLIIFTKIVSRGKPCSSDSVLLRKQEHVEK